MSAIFGIIDFEGRPIDPEWIKSMQKDLAHRGPDGQGLYQEDSMFMGHMLLRVTPESIYDTSPYEEDGLVITAYARLDEREAIMDRIGTPKEERERITDGLLLLRSYLKFGKDFVKDIYAPFEAQEISDKMAEMLTPTGMKAEVKILFQRIEDLHASAPEHTGDWYFTGNFPTPGGMRVVNKAFLNYYEGKRERAY